MKLFKILCTTMLVMLFFLIPLALQEKAVTKIDSDYSLIEVNVAHAGFMDFVSNAWEATKDFFTGGGSGGLQTGSGNQSGTNNNNFTIRNINNQADLAIYIDEHCTNSSNTCSSSCTNGVCSLDVIVPNNGSNNSPSPCTTAPDLQVTNLYMTSEDGTDKGSFNEKKIPLGTTVRMYETVENESCASTHSRKADGSTVWQSLPVLSTDNYNLSNTAFSWSWVDDTVNTPPYGDNGSFSITYEVDWNSKIGDPWTADETITSRNTSALAGWSSAERYRKLKLDTLGTHRLRVIADPLNTCTPNAGCIREGGSNNDNNSRTEEFTVVRPYIALQSFYVGTECGSPFCLWDLTVPKDTHGGNREITVLNRAHGLVWYPFGVDIATCVGDSRNLVGVDLSDYNATIDRFNDSDIHNRFVGRFGSKYYDVHITEPVQNAHTYTITCQGNDGNSYSDTVVLYNNLPNTDMNLEVQVADRTVKPGASLTTQKYEVRNTGLEDAVNYNHRARSQGVVIGGGPTATTLTVPGTNTWISQNIPIAWTAPQLPIGETSITVPFNVCVAHPDNTVSGLICDSANFIVTDSAVATNECSDGVDNDGDGQIDYGSNSSNDPGCTSGGDDDETDTPTGTTECSNGVDNGDTEDVLVDLNDPGCVNGADDTETNAVTTAPEITADGKETLTVRKNTEVTIKWDTGNNPNCSLSTNLSSNLSIPTPPVEEEVTVQNQTTYTIDCGAGGSDSVTIYALPDISET